MMMMRREKKRISHLDTPSFVFYGCYFDPVAGVVSQVEIRDDTFHLGLHDFCLRLPLTSSDGEVLSNLVAGVSCLQ